MQHRLEKVCQNPGRTNVVYEYCSFRDSINISPNILPRSRRVSESVTAVKSQKTNTLFAPTFTVKETSKSLTPPTLDEILDSDADGKSYPPQS